MPKPTPMRALIKDRRTLLIGGYAFTVLGSMLLWDAYEATGKARPLLARFLPS